MRQEDIIKIKEDTVGGSQTRCTDLGGSPLSLAIASWAATEEFRDQNLGFGRACVNANYGQSRVK